MSDELKPCPFCGARAACSVGNASFSGVELMGAGTDRPYVWCGTCGSSGSFEDTDAKAVAAWNTRADPAAIREALAACRIIDEAVREGHESVSELVLHLLSAAEPARAALALAKGAAE